METKSRVILYKELRDKISNRDSYSFEETKTRKKHLPPVAKEIEKEDKPERKKPREVSTSTLSLSVEELRKAKEEREKRKREEEAKSLYLDKRKKERKMRILRRVLLGLASALMVTAVILIVVFVRKGK